MDPITCNYLSILLREMVCTNNKTKHNFRNSKCVYAICYCGITQLLNGRDGVNLRMKKIQNMSKIRTRRAGVASHKSTKMHKLNETLKFG